MDFGTVNTGVPAVTFGDPIAKLDDLPDGTKFTATVDHATRTFGSHLDPSKKAFEIEKVSDGVFKVTADGKTYSADTITMLDGDSFATHVATDGKQELVYISDLINKGDKKVKAEYSDVVLFTTHKDFDPTNNNLPESSELYYASIGSVTPVLPTSSSVTYTGRSFGSHTSDVELVADFGTQNISGSMSNFIGATNAADTHTGSVTIPSTPITKDGFNADLTGSIGNFENITGTMTGQFYGGKVDEIAGTFNLKNDGSDVAFDVGGFIADRSDD